MKKEAEPAPMEARPIGIVRSALKTRDEAPRQGREGAPDAWLEIGPAFREGLEGILPGTEVLLLTWFHLASREPLKVHPRRNANLPLCGVFATRSPDRPNPIGLHRVTVLEVDPLRGLHVTPLEALDGTPLLDIKPVLSTTREE
ncbi:MAG: tRNA (N6-threonylcarbamoyladenosine(37)-N6)-methyltransferase TrmO [Acidobacteriota bacterium]